jgi:uncharacterized membrane protein (DUF373 family)
VRAGGVVPRRNDADANGESSAQPSRLRLLIAQGFGRAEDVVYVGLGILLACSAGALLISGVIGLWQSIAAGSPLGAVVNQLDRILLILMIVELLYTVQISFREHALVPEPFLIVGLIAATRRILVVTAEFGTLLEKGVESQFRNAMIELALLTLMVVALVASLRLLRKRDVAARADRV